MNNKNKNRGSTMVEVLVGFALLAVLVAGFTKIINLSGNMITQSKDMLREAELLEEKLYRGDDPENVTENVKLVEINTAESTDETAGESICLKLDNVTVETYVVDGTKGSVSISRFSHK